MPEQPLDVVKVDVDRFDNIVVELADDPTKNGVHRLRSCGTRMTIHQRAASGEWVVSRVCAPELVDILPMRSLAPQLAERLTRLALRELEQRSQLKAS